MEAKIGNKSVEACFRINRIYSRLGLTGEYSRRWFQKKFDENLITIVEEDGIVKSFAVANLYPGKDFVNLAIICVNPAFIGMGYGELVLNEFVYIWAAHKEYKNVFLNVNPTNSRAIEFYKSHDFVKFIPKIKIENSIIMQRVLNAEEFIKIEVEEPSYG